MPPTNASPRTPARFCIELDEEAVRVIETLIGQPFILLSAMHFKQRLTDLLANPAVVTNPAAATHQQVTFQLGEIAGAVGYTSLGMWVVSKFAEENVRDALKQMSEGN